LILDLRRARCVVVVLFTSPIQADPQSHDGHDEQQPVPIDSSTIDRIVANVLQQLGATGGAAPAPVHSSTSNRTAFSRDPQESAPAAAGRIELDDRVITAELLAERVNGAAVVAIAPKSILTPSARDFVNERGLRIDRASTAAAQAGRAASREPASGAADHQPSTTNHKPLLVIVRNTDAVARLWTDLQATWSRELLGCPDDAASLTIRELARGAVQTVVILAEQTQRAACLANRSPAVKAAAVRDAGDVAQVRRQLRANAWCIDPTRMSWFELRNVLSAVTKS
jgi:hypothetical protein